jgi:membrane-bound inhibitor of C-type lysozyme
MPVPFSRSFILRTALAIGGAALAAPAFANPATVDYICAPALPKGDRITIDWNSGGKSITVTFPNGKSANVPQALSGSGFRYERSNMMGSIEIFGKGTKELTLQLSGQPARTCTAQQPH